MKNSYFSFKQIGGTTLIKTSPLFCCLNPIYMSGDKHTYFAQSIKGKIIIASVLGCFTLLLAWGITKVAFKRMLNAVENISAPNDKLRLVNELTHRVVQLDQAQKTEVLNKYVYPLTCILD